MMPIESAVPILMRLAARLYERIEANEQKWQCMDGRKRSEIGAIRAVLDHAGVPKESLPETPFLEPEHLATYKRRQEAYRAQKAQEGEAA